MKRRISILAIALICGTVGSVQSQSYDPNQGWGPVEPPSYNTGRGPSGQFNPNSPIVPGMTDDSCGPGMESGYGLQGRAGRDLWKARYGARLTRVCNKFLDETVRLRRDLSRKRFDYYEALRSPQTGSDTLDRMEKEMSELNRKISAQNPHNCWGY